MVMVCRAVAGVSWAEAFTIVGLAGVAMLGIVAIVREILNL